MDGSPGGGAGPPGGPPARRETQSAALLWTQALLAVAALATMAGVIAFERSGEWRAVVLIVAGGLATLLLAALFVREGRAFRGHRPGRRGRGQGPG